MLIASDIFKPYKVEVLKLNNKYDKDQRLYRVNARIRWKCPSCGVPLSSIVKVKEIPLSILKEAVGSCPICNGPLRLENESINLISSSKFQDIINISGNLICNNCSSKIPLSKRIKANLRPVWSKIKKVKKVEVEVGKERIKFLYEE